MIIEAGGGVDTPVVADSMTLRLLYEVADGWATTGGFFQIQNLGVTAGSGQTCGEIANEGYDGGGDAIAFDGMAFSIGDQLSFYTTEMPQDVDVTFSHNVEIRLITETYQVTDVMADLLALSHTVITTVFSEDVYQQDDNRSDFLSERSYGHGAADFPEIYGILVRYYDIQADIVDINITFSTAFQNGFPRRYTN